MGCCCSKQEIAEKENEKEKALKNPRWDPPPPPPEEEKVKEVLSETPKAKPKPPPAPSSPVLKPVEKETGKDELEKKPKPKLSEIPMSDDRSEQPQPSDDACSLSEVSNATSVTTTTRERERDREEISTAATASSLPRIPRAYGNAYNRRSYSGELVRGGSRRERSSPAVVTGVGCRSGRTSPGPPSRNRSFSGNANGVKRDLGERSGRRSLSPGAKRREVAGPGVPGEKLGVNRGVPIRRVPPLPPNKAAAAAQLSEVGGGPGTEGKESLENPSVSLECFIFL